MWTLYFYHDPMCSWCWGYRTTSDLLFANLPENISRVNVLGGLAPDSDEPMSAELRQIIPGHWQTIHEMLGTEFNFAFWTECEPRRSTYPACRAIIAATIQERQAEMTLAIQEAYYLRAMNPSNTNTLELLAVEIKLDSHRFRSDLHSHETESELQRQIAFARSSPIKGFPSLALGSGEQLTAVHLDYKDYEETLKHLAMLMRQ